MKAKVWLKVLASAYGNGQGRVVNGKASYSIRVVELENLALGELIETDHTFRLDEIVPEPIPADLRLLDVGDIFLADLDIEIKSNRLEATNVTLREILIFPARLTSKTNTRSRMLPENPEPALAET